MEQVYDTTLIGAIVALIGAITLMLKQQKNGHANGNGTEAKINVEVERRVKVHDLRNDIQKIVDSVELQRMDRRKDREDFEEFRDDVREDLSFIKAKLQIEHRRGVARG